MLKAAAEIPGQSAKGKEQRQRYTPLLFEVEKFQVSVDASNIRQPSIHEGIVFQNKRMRRVLSPCSVVL